MDALLVVLIAVVRLLEMLDLLIEFLHLLSDFFIPTWL